MHVLKELVTTNPGIFSAMSFALITILFFVIQFVYAIRMKKEDADAIARTVLYKDDE